MQKDIFWKKFWSVVGLLLLAYLVVGGAYIYVHPEEERIQASVVDASYDPSVDPFEKPIEEEKLAVSDYLYRDSLPLEAEDWSWGTRVTWRLTGPRYEGLYAARAVFLEPEAGVRLYAAPRSLAPYASLSLAVYPVTEGEFYLELYDRAGNSLGRQSLEWYAPEGVLTLGAWTVLSIPLANLLPEGAPLTEQISGFAIVAEEPGTIFFDAVELQKQSVFYPRWEKKTLYD